MEAVKLDTLEKIAKGMAQELSIGSNTTDKYKLKDKVVYLHRDVKTKEIYIVDAATNKMIGEPIDGSGCTGRHFKTIEVFTNTHGQARGID